MSRVLKFRAWEKISKRMIQPHDGDFIKWHAMSNWKNCLEVMQFTGLTDIKGVEIYEGDILETPYHYRGNYFSGEDEESGLYRGKVHYTPSKGFIQRSVLVLDDENASGEWARRGPIDIRSKSARVIGNIYESPELLKVEG